MSIGSAIVDIFAGGAGLTTVISGGISAAVNLKERAMANAHELALLPHKQQEWKFQLEQQQRSIANDEFMAKKGLIESQRAGANLLVKTAIEADMAEAVAALRMKGQRWWVGAARTLNRPALTWGLLLVLFLTLFFNTSELDKTQRDTILTLARMGEAAFGFWFGGRIVQNRPN